MMSLFQLLPYMLETVRVPRALKVEATVSRVSLWVLGTVVGGTLGFVVMVDTHLAANPYALLTVICSFTFLVRAGARALVRTRAFVRVRVRLLACVRGLASGQPNCAAWCLG